MSVTTHKRCTLHPNAGVTLQLTPELKHYGRFNCSECEKFVVWARTPATSRNLTERQAQIVQIIKTKPWLTENHLHILLKLYSIPHLTMVNENRWAWYKRMLDNDINSIDSNDSEPSDFDEY